MIKLFLVAYTQVIVTEAHWWYVNATSHYLSQCLPGSMLIHGVTKPKWVRNIDKQTTNIFLNNYGRQMNCGKLIKRLTLFNYSFMHSVWFAWWRLSSQVKFCKWLCHCVYIELSLQAIASSYSYQVKRFPCIPMNISKPNSIVIDFMGFNYPLLKK